MSEPGATPTVIVARRARPGREQEFEAWLHALVAQADKARGHVGAEIQQPMASRPDEWVVIYRFASPDLLERWLDSPQRRTLLDQGEALSVGPAREQVVVLERGIDPVTAVVSVRVDPDHRDEYLELYHEIDGAMSRAPGFVRTEMFEPVPGLQDDTVVVFTFDGRDNLDAWLGSPERRAILERMQPFVETPHTINVVGGWGGWFDLGEHAPHRWKQAVVVLLALYPTVLLITLIDNRWVPDPPLPLDILIGNIISVAILTWLLMPRLTRALSAWLTR